MLDETIRVWYIVPRIVATGVTSSITPQNGTVVLTHYHVCWINIVPDVVHVLYKGRSYIGRTRLSALPSSKRKGNGSICFVKRIYTI